MPFALDGNPSPSEISDAINYILANLSPQTPPGQYVVNNNPTTGFISNSVGTLLQYQYRYLDVKYADNPAGLNFTDNPYGRLYFGLYNTDTVTESTDPNQYTWFQVTGGFGGTKTLWVVTAGGRHASFAASQEAPDLNQNWRLVPVRSIDLDNPFMPFLQWMSIKFATDSIGTGFSDSPTSKTYYGVATSDTNTTSTTPSDYEWSPFAFGTTYQLYYRSFGGRNISLVPATSKPIGYIPYLYGTTLNLEPMKKVANMLRNHKPLIMNWFKAKKLLSSGAVEGLNLKAKLTMRKAYGFKSPECLKMALYHTLGKLPEPLCLHTFS